MCICVRELLILLILITNLCILFAYSTAGLATSAAFFQISRSVLTLPWIFGILDFTLRFFRLLEGFFVTNASGTKGFGDLRFLVLLLAALPPASIV